MSKTINLGLAGAGGIIRNDEGRRIGERTQNIGVSSSIFEELWAIKTGLELTWEPVIRKIILGVDSEIVARAICEEHNDLGWNRGHYQDIRNFMRCGWLVFVKDTFREGKQVC